MPKIIIWNVRNKGSQQQRNLTSHRSHLLSDVTKEENISYLRQKGISPHTMSQERISSQITPPLEGSFSLTLGLTRLPIGKDASVVAFKGILKNILSKALENNILT